MLKRLISPVSLLIKKSVYVLPDVIMLLLFLIISFFLESATLTEPVKILRITLINLFFMWIIYSVTRYYFFRLIGQKRRFTVIFWKYILAMVVVFLISNVIFVILYLIIKRIVVEQGVGPVVRFLLGLFSFYGYFIILYFHKNYDKRFWRGLYQSVKGIFRIKNYRFLPYDLIIVAVFYLIFNLITWIFQFVLVRFYGQVSVLNNLFDITTKFIGVFMIAFVLTINKIIAYECK